MKSDIKDLIAISNQIGKNIAYIQGGGGNTSVKIDHPDLHNQLEIVSRKIFVLI